METEVDLVVSLQSSGPVKRARHIRLQPHGYDIDEVLTAAHRLQPLRLDLLTEELRLPANLKLDGDGRWKATAAAASVVAVVHRHAVCPVE
jgi:hypothetical protein